MSAATEEQPKVASPPATRVYMARREELVLTKRKDRPVRDETGQQIDIQAGQRVAFHDSRLIVPLDTPYLGPRGEEIDSRELVDWLEGNEAKGIRPHPLLGDRQEGFWLHEEAPPLPTEEEQTEVVRLAEERDVVGLEDLIAEEESGWNREGFVNVARTTLERVKERVAQDEQKLSPAPGAHGTREEIGDGS